MTGDAPFLEPHEEKELPPKPEGIGCLVVIGIFLISAGIGTTYGIGWGLLAAGFACLVIVAAVRTDP